MPRRPRRSPLALLLVSAAPSSFNNQGLTIGANASIPGSGPAGNGSWRELDLY